MAAQEKKNATVLPLAKLTNPWQLTSICKKWIQCTQQSQKMLIASALPAKPLRPTLYQNQKLVPKLCVILALSSLASNDDHSKAWGKLKFLASSQIVSQAIISLAINRQISEGKPTITRTPCVGQMCFHYCHLSIHFPGRTYTIILQDGSYISPHDKTARINWLLHFVKPLSKTHYHGLLFHFSSKSASSYLVASWHDFFKRRRMIYECRSTTITIWHNQAIKW